MDHNFFAFRRTGHLLRLLREQPAGWFARSWPEEMAEALAAVGARPGRQHGADDPALGLGPGATADAAAPPSAGACAGWRNVFDLGPFPCGGDADTINQASVLPLDPLRRLPTTSRRCAWWSMWAPGTTAVGRCPAASPAIRCRRTTTICSAVAARRRRADRLDAARSAKSDAAYTAPTAMTCTLHRVYLRVPRPSQWLHRP